jgi:hypothetical protein
VGLGKINPDKSHYVYPEKFRGRSTIVFAAPNEHADSPQRSLCGARAASGQAAAAPPMSLMNSRRFIRSPHRRQMLIYPSRAWEPIESE